MYEVKRLERVAHSLSVSSNLNTKMLDFEKEWIAECVAELQIEDRLYQSRTEKGCLL